MAGSKAKVTIKVSPTIPEIRKHLREQRAAIKDLKTPLAQASVYLDQWVQKNFKSEGGSVGGWEPFAQSTLDYMEKYDNKRSPAKLLQRTGRLRLSFVPFSSAKESGIGSDLPYSKSHNSGTSRIPERKLLPESGKARNEVMRDCREIMQEYTAKIMMKWVK